MADDDDPGTAHLKNFQGERQNAIDTLDKNPAPGSPERSSAIRSLSKTGGIPPEYGTGVTPGTDEYYALKKGKKGGGF